MSVGPLGWRHSASNAHFLDNIALFCNYKIIGRFFRFFKIKIAADQQDDDDDNNDNKAFFYIFFSLPLIIPYFLNF